MIEFIFSPRFDLHRIPNSEDLKSSLEKDILYLWLKKFEISDTLRGLDREDFLENVCFFLTAVTEGYPVTILSRGSNPRIIRTFNKGEEKYPTIHLGWFGNTPDYEKLQELVNCGPIVLPNVPSNNIVKKYWELETFKKYAGRSVICCHLSDSEEIFDTDENSLEFNSIKLESEGKRNLITC